MKHIRQHIIAEFSLLFLLCSSPVTAGLIFFTDNASFNVALQQQSLSALYTEDFEGWTGSTLQSFDDFLDSNNTHGLFATGIINGLRFQFCMASVAMLP
jgi:hypothetical protein